MNCDDFKKYLLQSLLLTLKLNKKWQLFSDVRERLTKLQTLKASSPKGRELGKCPNTNRIGPKILKWLTNNNVKNLYMVNLLLWPLAYVFFKPINLFICIFIKQIKYVCFFTFDPLQNISYIPYLNLVWEN